MLFTISSLTTQRLIPWLFYIRHLTTHHLASSCSSPHHLSPSLFSNHSHHLLLATSPLHPLSLPHSSQHYWPPHPLNLFLSSPHCWPPHLLLFSNSSPHSSPFITLLISTSAPHSSLLISSIPHYATTSPCFSKPHRFVTHPPYPLTPCISSPHHVSHLVLITSPHPILSLLTFCIYFIPSGRNLILSPKYSHTLSFLLILEYTVQSLVDQTSLTFSDLSLLHFFAWIGTFAETANVDCRSSFADQGKQTSAFCFPFAENQRKFAFSVFRLQHTNGSCRFPLVPIAVYMYTYCRQQIYRYIYP